LEHAVDEDVLRTTTHALDQGSGGHQHLASVALRSVEQVPHVARSAEDRDEGAGIEDEGRSQSGTTPGRLGLPSGSLVTITSCTSQSVRRVRARYSRSSETIAAIDCCSSLTAR